MPTVLTFWQTREDEEAFAEYLNRSGTVVAFPLGKRRSESELNPRAFHECLPADGRSFLYTLSEFKDQVVVNSYERDGYKEFGVSPIVSPVIGYESGVMSNRQLTPANVFAYWETLIGEGEAEEVVDKPDAFIKWGNNVFRWLRRRVKRRLEDKSLPMTESVANAIAEGLDVVQD